MITEQSDCRSLADGFYKPLCSGINGPATAVTGDDAVIERFVDFVVNPLLRRCKLPALCGKVSQTPPRCDCNRSSSRPNGSGRAEIQAQGRHLIRDSILNAFSARCRVYFLYVHFYPPVFQYDFITNGSLCQRINRLPELSLYYDYFSFWLDISAIRVIIQSWQ